MLQCDDTEFWGAVRKRSALSDEARRLDATLGVYYHAASGLTRIPRGRYILRHQDIESCTCALCVEWRMRRLEVERVQPIMEGHRWGNCGCPVCTIGRQLHFGFLGVTNKRDLWTEMSYHAHTDKAYRGNPAAVMRILKREMEDPRRTLNWWSLEGGRMPMGFWFRKIDKALGVNKEMV